jgi:hypothetical protein
MSTTSPSNPYEYSAPREDGDIDLVKIVRDMLIKIGQLPRVHLYDNSPKIKEAMSRRPDVQRFILNDYWNIQIMSVDADSIDVRYCLVGRGDCDTWLQLFESKVLPFIMEHNLPSY